MFLQTAERSREGHTRSLGWKSNLVSLMDSGSPLKKIILLLVYFSGRYLLVHRNYQITIINTTDDLHTVFYLCIISLIFKPAYLFLLESETNCDNKSLKKAKCSKNNKT